MTDGNRRASARRPATRRRQRNARAGRGGAAPPSPALPGKRPGQARPSFRQSGNKIRRSPSASSLTPPALASQNTARSSRPRPGDLPQLLRGDEGSPPPPPSPRPSATLAGQKGLARLHPPRGGGRRISQAAGRHPRRRRRRAEQSATLAARDPKAGAEEMALRPFPALRPISPWCARRPRKSRAREEGGSRPPPPSPGRGRGKRQRSVRGGLPSRW